MDIGVVYFLVVLFSTFIWIPVSLHYRLYLWALNIVTVRRRQLARLKGLKGLYESDDVAFGKSTPSRLGRGIVTSVFLLGNILMIFLPLKSTEYNLYTFSSRCGKLAAVNLIWSMILRLQITKAWILNTSTFQADVWISALLIWLSWHEAFAHVLLSFGHITLYRANPGPLFLSFGVLSLTALALLAVGQLTYPTSHAVLPLLLALCLIFHLLRTSTFPWGIIALIIACIGILDWKTRSDPAIAKYDKIDYSLDADAFKRVRIPVSRYLSHGSSPYFLLSGEIFHPAWLEDATADSNNRHSENYHAVLLCPPACKLEEDLRGPLYLPSCPFSRAPTGLDLVVLDNGIAEAFSCIWQRAQMMHHSLTFLTWFTKNGKLLKAYQSQMASEKLRAHRRKVEITVFYYEETVDVTIRNLSKKYHPLSRGHLKIHVLPPDTTGQGDFESIVQIHTPTNHNRYVIGENLRLYVN